VLLLISLSGCQKWIAFDLSRLAFGFILSLVIGLIGLIVMMFKGNDRNK
jgi:hypothetical protein